MRSVSSPFLLLAVHVTLALAASPVLAQQSPAATQAGTLEEIVVTAQRRTENLQDVPLAVTSFSAKGLEEQQITNTLDIARSVPNFIASNNVGQSSANVYYIRGLGQTQSFPTFEPQVGTYVDDVYISRQNANNFALFGVDQVQVLRGPQGTLFGRNSTGGAVVVSLVKPQATLGGDFEAGFGRFGRVFLRGALDAPFSDTLRTRTSVFGVTDSGYVHDLTTGERLNKTKDWGIREGISYVPNGKVEWNLSFDYSDSNAANVLNYPSSGAVNSPWRISYSGFSITGGALTGPNLGSPGMPPLQTGSKARRGQGVEVESYGAMSNVRIGFDAGVLNLITGYRGMRQQTDVDFPFTGLGPAVPFDQGPTGQFTIAQDLHSKEYSQEVKWTGESGPVKYTVGAFYLYETNNNDFGAVLNFGPLFGAAFVPFDFGDETTVNDTRSAAAYAQADFKISDAVTLTAGGRYTHETKSLTARPNTPTSGYTTAAIRAAGWLTDLSVNELTPRAALQIKASPNLMFYVSATRGFQGGGWNGLAFKASDFNNFAPETVWSYEGGMRSESSDHRFRFNANVFYENVKNYQLLSDNGSNFVTDNGADMEASGLETEIAWRPTDPLTLSLNVGLMSAKYKNPAPIVAAQQQGCQAAIAANNAGNVRALCGSGIVDPNGNLAWPSDTPHSTAALHATYDLMVGNFTVSGNAGAQFVGRQNVGTEGKPQGLNGAITTFDLAVSVKPNSMPLSFTLECRNCANKDWATAYLFGYRYYNVPGTWDMRVNYKF